MGTVVVLPSPSLCDKRVSQSRRFFLPLSSSRKGRLFFLFFPFLVVDFFPNAVSPPLPSIFLLFEQEYPRAVSLVKRFRWKRSRASFRVFPQLQLSGTGPLEENMADYRFSSSRRSCRQENLPPSFRMLQSPSSRRAGFPYFSLLVEGLIDPRR